MPQLGRVLLTCSSCRDSRTHHGFDRIIFLVILTVVLRQKLQQLYVLIRPVFNLNAV